MEIKIKSEDTKKAFALLARNEEIDVDTYKWITSNEIRIPDSEDGKETWNTIMILFEHENIQLD